MALAFGHRYATGVSLMSHGPQLAHTHVSGISNSSSDRALRAERGNPALQCITSNIILGLYTDPSLAS